MYDRYFGEKVNDFGKILEKDFKDYLRWCKDNREKPEVTKIEKITEDNISHVRYHAKLFRGENP